MLVKKVEKAEEEIEVDPTAGGARRPGRGSPDRTRHR